MAAAGGFMRCFGRIYNLLRNACRISAYGCAEGKSVSGQGQRAQARKPMNGAAKCADIGTKRGTSAHECANSRKDTGSLLLVKTLNKKVVQPGEDRPTDRSRDEGVERTEHHAQRPGDGIVSWV